MNRSILDSSTRLVVENGQSDRSVNGRCWVKQDMGAGLKVECRVQPVRLF